MADDAHETDRTAPDTSAPDTSARVPDVDTSREEQRLAESQRKIDEAKAVATDLARTTPDPLPEAERPSGSTPGS